MSPCETHRPPRGSCGHWLLATTAPPLRVVHAFVLGPGRVRGWNRCKPRHLISQGAPWVMKLNLHANATTTPKVRAYIQRSKKSAAELAAELGVGETTIRRWRSRPTVDDRSHRPHRLMT